MATIVLGTAGRLIGGPIGGIIGTTLGGVIDSSLFGGGAPRGGRLASLAVQSAAYGEPVAVVTGKLRVAGNLLWSSGIKESTSGGGKVQGSSYAYTSSFAVGLSGRAIQDVGRIWADGQLIRDSNGQFVSPIKMRLHTGGEGQRPDPLIVALEGGSGAPAYRGIAYAVFEDLSLADYGNRIPNLTFEVIADDPTDLDAGSAIAALAVADGRPLAIVEGRWPSLTGHFAGQSGSIADALAPLMSLAGAAIWSGEGLAVRGPGGEAIPIAAEDCHARLPLAERRRERGKLLGGETRAGAVEVSFYDVSRDYQPGLQRSRRDASGQVDQRAIACAMTPGEAKALAADILARSEAARWQLSVRLPWRHLGVRPGDRVVIEGQAGGWKVRQARFESFIVNLELERDDAIEQVTAPTDGGRSLAFAELPAGETSLAVLDLPTLPGEQPSAPRLLVAAAGAAPGWRRALVQVSADGGESYVDLPAPATVTPMGLAETALPIGPTDRWDRFSTVDVTMLTNAMWLEARPEASVLAGANLALVGNEIIQFANAEALSPGRFRLTGLLRGRLGTEAAIPGHAAGERFVVLDRQSMLSFAPPPDALGRAMRFRPAGRGDAETAFTEVIAAGRALRPLAPVNLRIARTGNDLEATWVRRSRVGSGWPDFVDVPLAEAEELYQVTVELDGRLVRTVTTAAPQYRYAAADRLADGDGTVVSIAVLQRSAAVGPGDAVSASCELSVS